MHLAKRFVLTLALSVVAWSVAAVWSLGQDASPSPRHGHRMVYDASRKLALMFGGRTVGKIYLGDTWGWNGETWKQLSQEGPSPRAWSGLAYDDRRAVAVLFGGRDASGSPLADTWEWDGTRWTLADQPRPAARDHHAMAYHPDRAKAVMHGGYDGSESFGDTWEWDGREWSQVTSAGPGERDAHQLVYDPSIARVVLFGGLYLDEGKAVVLGDTWGWNGEWKMLDAGKGNGRSHLSIAFDPDCECLLRFGGGDPERVPRDRTWRFEQGKWNEMDVDGPDIRVDHDMVLDSSRDTIILFGGYIPTPGGRIFGDTWEWNGGAWNRR